MNNLYSRKERIEEMTRITKEPDVRKQEILDAAMELFAAKGYEKTTIADIANKLHISQGLYYRYFKTKDEIFEAGLEHYANHFVEIYKADLSDASIPLGDRIKAMRTYKDVESQDSIYYRFFHTQTRKSFHTLLFIRVCEKMHIIFTQLIQEAMDRGDVFFDNPGTAASFLVYGQHGIMTDPTLSDAEKIQESKSFMLSVLEKFSRK
jgi:AcrR family transcriptional regulator